MRAHLCLQARRRWNAENIKPHQVKIRVHDGIEIAVALYRPEGDGPHPVVLAASPYRCDNNTLPATPQFLWRETGPIELYVERGYVYAQMDVRGCGKSGGELRFLDRNEQKDLYDVIEWLARQSWSNGKVGGIGQSYFCMVQWWTAIQRPPSLACIAAFDGLNDPYRASVYQGGILGDFLAVEPRREQTCDLNLLPRRHPTYDEFWRERCAAEHLHEIEVPLYSIGVGARSTCIPASISTAFVARPVRESSKYRAAGSPIRRVRGARWQARWQAGRSGSC